LMTRTKNIKPSSKPSLWQLLEVSHLLLQRYLPVVCWYYRTLRV
jgi:hypothetical protein